MLRHHLVKIKSIPIKNNSFHKNRLFPTRHYVIDCAKGLDDMEMINFAHAMENNGKDEKNIKPYVAQYKEQENTAKAKLLSIAVLRLIILTPLEAKRRL